MDKFGPPPPPRGMEALAVGTYTEIVDIVAPGSAAAGSTVNVEVKIKNRWTDYIHIYCVALPDSAFRFIDWQEAWVGPGETKSFYGGFIMGDGDVRINAYSYYEATDGDLYLDDTKSKVVKVAALTPEFANFGISQYDKV